MFSFFFSYGADHTSELHIAGRIVLNIWRLMRNEVAFYSYTFENMMYHVRHERVAKFDHPTLTRWWNEPRGGKDLNRYILKINNSKEEL